MPKPGGPGVTRASIVLVWHAGQRGREMIMTFALGSGGSTTLLVTGRSRYSAVITRVDSPYVRESTKFRIAA